jgi:hypothetical protein
MANTDIIMPLESGTELPVVREIGFSDLKLALEKGFDDFRAMPTHDNCSPLRDGVTQG